MRRAKEEGRNSYGGFSTSSTVSQPSQQARDMGERCCSCTRNSTCSTTGPSARACKFRNSGRQCTGCHYWGKFWNKRRIMPSPATARVLLGKFPRVADPPANDRRATTLPVRLPKNIPCGKYRRAGPGVGARGGGGERPLVPEGGGERGRRGDHKRGMEQGERGEQRNIGREYRGGGGGPRPADSVVMGHARKQRDRATGGCRGRQE